MLQTFALIGNCSSYLLILLVCLIALLREVVRKLSSKRESVCEQNKNMDIELETSNVLSYILYAISDKRRLDTHFWWFCVLFFILTGSQR